MVKGLEKAVAQSDLKVSTTLVQQPNVNPWQHFFDVLDAMCAADADYVIRLEDDAIINRHLRHNCLTWPAAHRPRFGAGWLYSAPRSSQDFTHHDRKPRFRGSRLEGCVAVLFKRLTLVELLPRMRAWAKQNPAGYCYDFAISIPILDSGYEIWLHRPVIAEHNRHLKSAFGHVILPSHHTQGAFKPNWRRPV